jgi:hypothetical protein
MLPEFLRDGKDKRKTSACKSRNQIVFREGLPGSGKLVIGIQIFRPSVAGLTIG